MLCEMTHPLTCLVDSMSSLAAALAAVVCGGRQGPTTTHNHRSGRGQQEEVKNKQTHKNTMFVCFFMF